MSRIPDKTSKDHPDTECAVLPMDAHGFVHATTVAIDGQGVMLIGPSGVGKSSLALQLIGLGARLVADDRTRIAATPDAPMAYAPKQMVGLIEARGVGLLSVPHVPSAPVALVVDMAQVESERLPPARPVTFVVNQPVKTLWRVDAPSFPSALFYLMKLGGHGHEHG